MRGVLYTSHSAPVKPYSNNAEARTAFENVNQKGGDNVIAELHNKVTRNNSNLTELSEDELTGNFFGQLRYLPFNMGLKPILKNSVFPPEIAALFDGIDAEFLDDKIEFWPYDSEGELDVYLEFSHIAIGIEVKYTSGLSSDDDVDYSMPEEKMREVQSRNQLQRESRIITRKAKKKTKILLLVGSETACADIYSNIRKRKLLLDSDVLFGYAAWQSVLQELRKLKIGDPYQALIISDLISLLSRKGFDRFDTMDSESSCCVSRDVYYRFEVPAEMKFSFENNLPIAVEGEYWYEFK